MITKSLIVEIQKLVVNPKSSPVKSISVQYQFLFKYLSSKNQRQNFSKQRKNTKGIFSKNSGYVQLQGSPSIQMSKKQSGLVVKPNIIPSLSTCKNRSFNLLNLSNYLWDTPDLRVPYSIRLHHFWPCPLNYYQINL